LLPIRFLVAGFEVPIFDNGLEPSAGHRLQVLGSLCFLLVCHHSDTKRRSYESIAVIRSSVMQDQPCDQCGKTARLHVNSDATQLTFGCDVCGAVWILDRTDPTKPPCLGRRPTPEPKPSITP